MAFAVLNITQTQSPAVHLEGHSGICPSPTGSSAIRRSQNCRRRHRNRARIPPDDCEWISHSQVRIWLCHLAPNVPPSSELYGYDVSADQFIPADHLPKNVKLEALDATKEPPASLQGSFDVVHLRLLQIVVNNDDPQPILDHCCKLLSMLTSNNPCVDHR